jgi:hypothetical protein
MKISQLKSLIKESIKEVLKENEINTIDYKKLKAIYTLAGKLKLYEPYMVDETIEDIKALENAVKTNDESIFETMEESQVDTYELSGLANLNPEQQAKWKGIDIALRELSRIIYKMDFNLIGEKFKKLAVAINNFNAPAMQEKRKMSLKENSPLDPKLAGYWVMKDKNYAISMYPSKQEAEIAFKNRVTKYGSHALNSGWKIMPAEEFVSTGGLLATHTNGHPDYVSPYRRPARNDAERAANKKQDRLDNIAHFNREMER